MAYLRFPKCFLSGSFAKEDQGIFDWFRKLAEAVDFEVITGEEPAPHVPAETIRARIESCNVLVAIYSKRDKIGGTEEWRPPPFVADEVAMAYSLGKPVAIFAELGVRVEGIGPQTTTYEPWSREDLGGSAPNVVRYLVNLRNEVSPPLELQGDVPTARALFMEVTNRYLQIEKVTETLEIPSWSLAHVMAGLSGRLLTFPTSLISAVEEAYDSVKPVTDVLEQIERAREKLLPKLSLPRWATDQPLPALPKNDPLWGSLVVERDKALMKNRWAGLLLARFGWPSDWKSLRFAEVFGEAMSDVEFKQSFGHERSELVEH